MQPAYDDNFCRMFVGDASEVLSQLPEQSIHCCVTSPPYFGLRSYLAADHPDKAKEGGTQETPEQYVQWLVEVFRGVWRVLRDDGTLWLNLGDSYANVGNESPNKTRGPEDAGGRIGKHAQTVRHVGTLKKRMPTGYKTKDLLMIPARVALALQQDGWFLRSQIVWTKPNPMPESVTDRPTQATEMVYLLTKKPRYFYDAEAVKEPHAGPLHAPGNKGEPTVEQIRGQHVSKGMSGHYAEPERVWGSASGRNLRNYWQISTRPYPGSHYATFPPELPLRCIKAGTSEHGVCSECGTPWRRVVKKDAPYKRPDSGAPVKRLAATDAGNGTNALGATTLGRVPTGRTIGFEPTCSHNAQIQPAIVLDPFSGSGTTGLVARRLGRRSVLIDLDDRNVKLLEQRLGWQAVLF